MTFRDVKRNHVIDTAIKLFIERSIASVTVRDIAKASGMGEATVYRYFRGKSGLVVACGVKLQGMVGKAFTNYDGVSNGYMKLEKFYYAYCSLFIDRPELYRFLNEFDLYCYNEGVGEQGDLDEYSDNIDIFKVIYMDAYRSGLKDGSVREVEDIETFYYATTHAMLAFCKKLASDDGILRQDKLMNKSKEAETLVRIILSSLKSDCT